jgi:hypothetical protein
MPSHEPQIFLIDGETMGLQQITGVTLLTAFSIATASIAEERKIKRSDLSAAETNVAAQSAGATFEGFREEKENSIAF